MEKNFQKTFNDLLIYMNPEYFQENFFLEEKKGKEYEPKKIKKYWEILSSIDLFLKKLSKYEIYFKKFYPNNKTIPAHEALEHHIHAYLEDLQTLRNKISDNYLITLKKDLKKIASNKKEIDEAVTWLKTQVDQAFTDVSKLRNPHRHHGYLFADPYVTEAKVAYTTLNNDLKLNLSEYGKKELKKKLKTSFVKGKDWWSKNAKENYNEAIKMTNSIMEKTNDFLYNVLDIQPLNIPEYKQK